MPVPLTIVVNIENPTLTRATFVSSVKCFFCKKAALHFIELAAQSGEHTRVTRAKDTYSFNYGSAWPGT